MSKCDFQIVFDRPDRTYSGGEPVRGVIQVDVNRDFTCDAVVIEHFWRTHGRGNRAQGETQKVTMPAMEFRAGQSHRFPFEFTAPYGPPTYHGEHLNIDHYVKVLADLPWAIDPSKEEDYLLRPGCGEWENLPAPSTPRQATVGGGWGLGLLGAGMIALGVFLFNLFGLFVGLAGIPVLLKGLHAVLVQGRIGQIDVAWGSLTAGPGGLVPVTIRMTPPKSFAINAVTAQLVGREECVSGSGTSRTTHKHVFYQRTFTLAESTRAVAGRVLEVSGACEIPATEAYSFHAEANDCIWSIELRIDIPLWPDWTQEQVLVVRPASGQSPTQAAGPTGRRSVPDAAGPTSSASIAQETVPSTLDEPVPEEPVGGSADLADLIAQILAAPSYGPEREEVVAQCAGQTFDCRLVVERIDRTFGALPEAFRDGRTLVGRPEGLDCPVAVQLPAARNPQAESLPGGQTFRTTVTPVKWDIIYERLVLRHIEA